MQGGQQRNNSDSDRWQRGTAFQKGLMPSPHTPLQMMHKAEKKYEIGKVTDQEEAKQRKLRSILNKLTPENFEKLFEQVKQVNIDNVVTLSGVTSQIFDRAVTEPIFCEMYVEFCFHLASELPDLSIENERITFKRLLLNKCQEEFERGEREEEEANKADGVGEAKLSEAEREEKRLKARRRMLGNIRLIGELYKKRMLTERIMHECIRKLLGQYQNPDEEDVEALCILMSTMGETIDHPKAKVHMDAYFDTMAQLSNNMKLSSRVRFMLKDAIDLKKNKWQQRRKVEDLMPKHMPVRFASRTIYDQSHQQERNMSYETRDIRSIDGNKDRTLASSPTWPAPLTSVQNISSENSLPEELLRDRSIAAIREFYSVNDVNEVALCIKDLNSPSFYPSMISIWITDSFERKDMERELLTKLLVNLAKPQGGLLSEDHFIKGFEFVLANLEDAVNDAPRAVEFLGRIFAKMILEDIVPFSEIGRLVYEGGAEPGRLVVIGLAAEVVGSILETIKFEKGDSVLSEIRSSSNLQLENFRPPGTNKSWRIDKFI